MPMDVNLTNIEAPDQLLNYAAIAQLAQVRKLAGYPHARVASNLPRYSEPASFSKRLKHPPDDFLQLLTK